MAKHSQALTWPKRGPMIGQWLLLVIPAVFVVAVVAFATLQPVKVLPRIRPAPAFLLTDQTGRRVSNESLRGQVVLYAFGYTDCGAGCAPSDAVMKAVYPRLAELTGGGLPLTLATMLFDSTHDTPDAIQGYAKDLSPGGAGIDASKWLLLTGDAARLKQTIGGGFEVYYAQGPSGDFTFEPALVLVDGLGIIRGEFRSQNQNLTPEIVVRQIEVLQQEVANNQGAKALAYEAAHLFLCYAH